MLVDRTEQVPMLRDALYAVRVHTASGQLDGERNTVELAADSRNNRSVALLQHKAVGGSGDPIRKELRGGKRQGLRCGKRIAHRRAFQRRQIVDLFALDA